MYQTPPGVFPAEPKSCRGVNNEKMERSVRQLKVSMADRLDEVLEVLGKHKSHEAQSHAAKLHTQLSAMYQNRRRCTFPTCWKSGSRFWNISVINSPIFKWIPAK